MVLNHHPHSHIVTHVRPKAASHPQWYLCPRLSRSAHPRRPSLPLASHSRWRCRAAITFRHAQRRAHHQPRRHPRRRRRASAAPRAAGPRSRQIRGTAYPAPAARCPATHPRLTGAVGGVQGHARTTRAVFRAVERFSIGNMRGGAQVALASAATPCSRAARARLSTSSCTRPAVSWYSRASMRFARRPGRAATMDVFSRLYAGCAVLLKAPSSLTPRRHVAQVRFEPPQPLEQGGRRVPAAAA